MSKGDFSISQRSGLTNDTLPIWKSRPLVGRQDGRFDIILMSRCFLGVSDKRAALLLGREGVKSFFSGEVRMKGLV